ncbi:hypothetical protein PR048_004698 [Dryococelus australis]|uniref:Retrotransposon gag domain-containing protein n=1 Tax=Dryococelus australis TaxID=614101 RepID=A0ABQ9I817_9NEOP|nr:hypothetical protein PR048_004698 [Dryococelus australis]
MDSLIKPIKKLRRDCDVAKNWLQWRKKFKYYHEAVGSASLLGLRQIALLVCLMGNDAEDFYKSFTFGEKEVKTLEVVLNKFDAFFLPRRNLIYKSQIFFTCSQREGQTFDTYLAELRKKSSNM